MSDSLEWVGAETLPKVKKPSEGADVLFLKLPSCLRRGVRRAGWFLSYPQNIRKISVKYPQIFNL